MSDLQTRPDVELCGGERDPAQRACVQRLPGRAVSLSTRRTPGQSGPGLTVERYLPTKARRMIGAWCFVDVFGPHDLAGDAGMVVGPHPHTGLQTVTWLFEGAVDHRDSLGTEQRIVPGQLNLMSSGSGISHSEESPDNSPPRLHGVQLWVALPDSVRNGVPRFDHLAAVPEQHLPGLKAQVLLGDVAGVASPARTHTPIVGAVVSVDKGAGTGGESSWLPLRRTFEHGVLLIDGDLRVDDIDLRAGELVYLGTRRDGVDLLSRTGARLLLLGGLPFEEEIVMWWNFVGRTHDEIVSARAMWSAHTPRFGRVVGAKGPRLEAPPMPNVPLRPRGRA